MRTIKAAIAIAILTTFVPATPSLAEGIPPVIPPTTSSIVPVAVVLAAGAAITAVGVGLYVYVMKPADQSFSDALKQTLKEMSVDDAVYDGGA